MPQDPNVEVAITIEDFASVIGIATGIENGECTLPKKWIEATLPGRQQLLDLVLRQTLEGAARGDAGVDDFGDDNAGFQEALRGRLRARIAGGDQGRMLIGVPSATSIQNSIMSALVRAMQPSVQSSRA